MAAGKAIFITGGGSGIGRAMGLRFAREGWFIGLGDVDAEGMAETVGLLPRGGSFCHPLDVRDPAQWERALAAFAKAAGGAVHVVANNAGVSHAGAIADHADNQVAQLIDVNVLGVVNGARAAFPWLRASAPNSCLLNTASASAIYGVGGIAVYSASKFAVRGLTEALDCEWADDGIRVRSIMPGFIDTPMLQLPSHPGSAMTKRESVLKAGMALTPIEDVAQAAWDAVHGKGLHRPVGRVARLMELTARWAPAYLRYRSRKLMNVRLGRDG